MKFLSNPIIFTAEQREATNNKNGKRNQLFFAVMLKFFETHGYFPKELNSDLQNLIVDIAIQIDCDPVFDYNWSSRLNERFKKEIRLLFKFRTATIREKDAFILYCKTSLFPTVPKDENQEFEQAYAYFKSLKLEPYSKKQMKRFLEEAHHQFESELFKNIEKSLSPQIKASLDKLLEEENIQFSTDKPSLTEDLFAGDKITLTEFKSGQVELKNHSILYEIQKFNYLKTINIPAIVETFGTRKAFYKYYMRVLAESPSSLKEHKSSIRYAYLAMFCIIQHQIMADNLTDLLIKLLKQIVTKAERKVDKLIKAECKRVKGKLGTLLVLAKTSIDHPQGIIRETIYPNVPQDRLIDITNELGSNESWYQNQVKSKAISLYTHNNRRIVWAIIDALDLQTTFSFSRILSAVKIMKQINTANNPLKDRLYDATLLNNFFSSDWISLIAIAQDPSTITAVEKIDQPSESFEQFDSFEESLQSLFLESKLSSEPTKEPAGNTKVKISWNAFELGVFAKLEKEIKVKNIWVHQSYRYRNPEEDGPKDFYENKTYYFAFCNLPEDVNDFVDSLKERADKGLSDLNTSILENPKVIIKDRKKQGAIKITPFEPQKEPKNLELLKAEIVLNWPHLHLIDILKEADFRIGFSKRFQTVASRKVMSKERLQKRLLLCIFGLGSNIGLKRMSGFDQDQENYNSLRYVKRRYFTVQGIRFAIQDVVNAILQIRDSKIWGTATTTCSADSKKISVWDQNLIVEWHTRYKGRGVMIYWHVDKHATCIYSHIKTCSSSEVAAMIKGVLNHDTDMDLQQVCIDTHGQSSIGFAYSELLHFLLCPRIKNINKQKLYASARSKKEAYPNLTPALASESINWSKITQETYTEAVRWTVALKTGTVDPEVMIRRLSADNKANPVYQALMEIGKASRTIFLCRYLSSEEFRIEINDALNVVERVNGLMGFIFYGRLGELSTNNTTDQELSLLCLHLLQVCMVYINTIFIQTVLSNPKWDILLTVEDKRALSPLLHGHINPYGLLFLDMNTRIIIENRRYRAGSSA